MEKTGMSEALLTDVRFHRLLLAYDDGFGETGARPAGVVRCGGVLHSARYRRKPRGLPAGLGEEYRQRFSFCCAVRECRRRKTVRSLRFLGPKVYAAAIVVLVSALRVRGAAGWPAAPARAGGREPAHHHALAPLVVRDVPGAPVLAKRACELRYPGIADALPASLLERFSGDPATQLLAALRFLGPLTGGAMVLAM